MLAARIYILRHRIEHVKEYNRDPSVEPMEVPTPRSMLAEPEPDETPQAEEPDVADDMATSIMKEVKTIETGEINGVRIPAGITIMVNQEDAERMIANGKAVYVVKDEDGNTVQLDETAAMPKQNSLQLKHLFWKCQNRRSSLMNMSLAIRPQAQKQSRQKMITLQAKRPALRQQRLTLPLEDAAEAEAATDIATDTAIEAEADTDNGAVSEKAPKLKKSAKPESRRLKMARLACSAMRILPAGLMLSVLAVMLSGCINLERFRHEKYSCTNNRAGVDEVIIRRAKKGAEVKIFSGGTEKQARLPLSPMIQLP